MQEIWLAIGINNILHITLVTKDFVEVVINVEHIMMILIG